MEYINKNGFGPSTSTGNPSDLSTCNEQHLCVKKKGTVKRRLRNISYRIKNYFHKKFYKSFKYSIKKIKLECTTNKGLMMHNLHHCPDMLLQNIDHIIEVYNHLLKRIENLNEFQKYCKYLKYSNINRLNELLTTFEKHEERNGEVLKLFLNSLYLLWKDYKQERKGQKTILSKNKKKNSTNIESEESLALTKNKVPNNHTYNAEGDLINVIKDITDNLEEKGSETSTSNKSWVKKSENREIRKRLNLCLSNDKYDLKSQTEEELYLAKIKQKLDKTISLLGILNSGRIKPEQFAVKKQKKSSLNSNVGRLPQELMNRNVVQNIHQKQKQIGQENIHTEWTEIRSNDNTITFQSNPISQFSEFESTLKFQDNLEHTSIYKSRENACSLQLKEANSNRMSVEVSVGDTGVCPNNNKLKMENFNPDIPLPPEPSSSDSDIEIEKKSEEKSYLDLKQENYRDKCIQWLESNKSFHHQYQTDNRSNFGQRNNKISEQREMSKFDLLLSSRKINLLNKTKGTLPIKTEYFFQNSSSEEEELDLLEKKNIQQIVKTPDNMILLKAQEHCNTNYWNADTIVKSGSSTSDIIKQQTACSEEDYNEENRKEELSSQEEKTHESSYPTVLPPSKVNSQFETIMECTPFKDKSTCILESKEIALNKKQQFSEEEEHEHGVTVTNIEHSQIADIENLAVVNNAINDVQTLQLDGSRHKTSQYKDCIFVPIDAEEQLVVKVVEETKSSDTCSRALTNSEIIKGEHVKTPEEAQVCNSLSSHDGHSLTKGPLEKEPTFQVFSRGIFNIKKVQCEAALSDDFNRTSAEEDSEFGVGNSEAFCSNGQDLLDDTYLSLVTASKMNTGTASTTTGQRYDSDESMCTSEEGTEYSPVNSPKRENVCYNILTTHSNTDEIQSENDLHESNESELLNRNLGVETSKSTLQHPVTNDFSDSEDPNKLNLNHNHIAEKLDQCTPLDSTHSNHESPVDVGNINETLPNAHNNHIRQLNTAYMTSQHTEIKVKFQTSQALQFHTIQHENIISRKPRTQQNFITNVNNKFRKYSKLANELKRKIQKFSERCYVLREREKPLMEFVQLIQTEVEYKDRSTQSDGTLKQKFDRAIQIELAVTLTEEELSVERSSQTEREMKKRNEQFIQAEEIIDTKSVLTEKVAIVEESIQTEDINVFSNDKNIQTEKLIVMKMEKTTQSEKNVNGVDDEMIQTEKEVISTLSQSIQTEGTYKQVCDVSIQPEAVIVVTSGQIIQTESTTINESEQTEEVVMFTCDQFTITENMNMSNCNKSTQTDKVNINLIKHDVQTTTTYGQLVQTEEAAPIFCQDQPAQTTLMGKIIQYTDKLQSSPSTLMVNIIKMDTVSRGNVDSESIQYCTKSVEENNVSYLSSFITLNESKINSDEIVTNRDDSHADQISTLPPELEERMKKCLEKNTIYMYPVQNNDYDQDTHMATANSPSVLRLTDGKFDKWDKTLMNEENVDQIEKKDPTVTELESKEEEITRDTLNNCHNWKNHENLENGNFLTNNKGETKPQIGSSSFIIKEKRIKPYTRPCSIILNIKYSPMLPNLFKNRRKKNSKLPTNNEKQMTNNTVIHADVGSPTRKNNSMLNSKSQSKCDKVNEEVVVVEHGTISANNILEENGEKIECRKIESTKSTMKCKSTKNCSHPCSLVFRLKSLSVPLNVFSYKSKFEHLKARSTTECNTKLKNKFYSSKHGQKLKEKRTPRLHSSLPPESHTPPTINVWNYFRRSPEISINQSSSHEEVYSKHSSSSKGNYSSQDHIKLRKVLYLKKSKSCPDIYRALEKNLRKRKIKSVVIKKSLARIHTMSSTTQNLTDFEDMIHDLNKCYQADYSVECKGIDEDLSVMMEYAREKHNQLKMNDPSLTSDFQIIKTIVACVNGMSYVIEHPDNSTKNDAGMLLDQTTTIKGTRKIE